MRFLRLTAAEWTGIGVLVMAATFGTQWLAERDARARASASIERKVDALFSWADLVSQMQGWPRPQIADSPVALPPAPPARVDGPFALQFTHQQPACPQEGRPNP